MGVVQKQEYTIALSSQLSCSMGHSLPVDKRFQEICARWWSIYCDYWIAAKSRHILMLAGAPRVPSHKFMTAICCFTISVLLLVRTSPGQKCDVEIQEQVAVGLESICHQWIRTTRLHVLRLTITGRCISVLPK